MENDKTVNCLTRGILDYLEKNNEVSEGIALWYFEARKRISLDLPDFVVGCPETTTERIEDEGRTLILPIKSYCPKCYAVYNETSGVTFMLASEY